MEVVYPLELNYSPIETKKRKRIKGLLDMLPIIVKPADGDGGILRVVEEYGGYYLRPENVRVSYHGIEAINKRKFEILFWDGMGMGVPRLAITPKSPPYTPIVLEFASKNNTQKT